MKRTLSMLAKGLVIALLVTACGGEPATPEDQLTERLEDLRDDARAIIAGDKGLIDLAGYYNPECRNDFVEAIVAAEALGVDVNRAAAAQFQAAIDDGLSSPSPSMQSDDRATFSDGVWIAQDGRWYLEDCE